MPRRRVADIDPLVVNLAPRRAVEIHDAARDGGLARPGLADKAEHLAPPDLERHIVHRADKLSVPQREHMAQMAHIEQNVPVIHAGHLPPRA